MNSLVHLAGKEVRIKGRIIRVGKLEADTYQFLDDPGPMLEALRKHSSRVDLFTFMQRLPESSAKFDYPMEWDNLAALRITTFDEWWTENTRVQGPEQSEAGGKARRDGPRNSLR